jgi:hypothetical protein
VLGVLVCPAGAAIAAERPDASFTFSPEDPRAGQTVRFESSSCDPDGRLVRQAWDLDGDGVYDDAEGPVASLSFSGSRSVGLRITAAGGETDVQRRTVLVDTEYALPRPEADRLMRPFPVVRLAAHVMHAGAAIRALVVRGPVCSLVEVRCRGKSCPQKRASAYIGRKPLRFRRFERRLRAGTVLTIRISKNVQIGKFTQVRIRSDDPPKRLDRCLRPGQKAGSACPRD